VTLNLAETSVVKSSPSVPYWANLLNFHTRNRISGTTEATVTKFCMQ